MTALSITSLMLMEAIWLITALYGVEGTTAFLPKHKSKHTFTITWQKFSTEM